MTYFHSLDKYFIGERSYLFKWTQQYVMSMYDTYELTSFVMPHVRVNVEELTTSDWNIYMSVHRHVLTSLTPVISCLSSMEIRHYELEGLFSGG